MDQITDAHIFIKHYTWKQTSGPYAIPARTDQFVNFYLI
mgnify:CR=1 FL=1